MATIGSLDVVLRAQTKKFSQGMKRARRETGKFRKSILNVRTAVAGLTSALAIGRIKSLFDEFDAIGKTSKRLGIAAENLQVLQEAAELTGNSVRNLNLGLQRMIRRVAEAAQGTGEAKAAIKELGLDAVALAKLTPDEQFLQIADAMAKVRTQSDRIRLGFKLFDSEGVGLINTLKLGRKGLDEVRASMEESGRIMTTEQIQKIEKVNDAWTRLWRTIRTGSAKALVAIEEFVNSKAATEYGLFFNEHSPRAKSDDQIRKEIEASKKRFAAIAEAARKRNDEMGKIVAIPQGLQDRVLGTDLASQFKEQAATDDAQRAFLRASEIREDVDHLAAAGENMGHSFVRAGLDVARGFRSVEDAVRSFADTLVDSMARAATQATVVPLFARLFSGIGSAFASGGVSGLAGSTYIGGGENVVASFAGAGVNSAASEGVKAIADAPINIGNIAGSTGANMPIP